MFKADRQLKLNMFSKASILAIAGVAVLMGCGGGDTASTADPGGSRSGTAGPAGGAGAAAAGGTVDMAQMATMSSVMQKAGLTPEDLMTIQQGGIGGVPTMMDTNPILDVLKADASNIRFGSRRDPFALLPKEKAFDVKQRNERELDSLGGFTMFFTPPAPKPDERETLEPPPAGFRLAGILQGNGIVALMTQAGQPAKEIRPGTRFNDEWVCVSIDAEKAVFRRLNNKRPSEWIVRLQGIADLGGAPSGGSGGGGASGPSGPGQGPGAPPDEREGR